MSESDTPRTDANTWFANGLPNQCGYVVSHQFAKELERRLNANTAEIERLKAENAKLTKERDEALMCLR